MIYDVIIIFFCLFLIDSFLNVDVYDLWIFNILWIDSRHDVGERELKDSHLLVQSRWRVFVLIRGFRRRQVRFARFLLCFDLLFMIKDDTNGGWPLFIDLKGLCQHPRMLLDLLESRTVFGVGTKHLHQKVLKHWELVIDSNLIPVSVKVSFDDAFIKLVLWRGILKREDAEDQGEQDHAGREHIRLAAIVHYPLAYLWCHVSLCAHEGVEAIDVFISCETKISQLDLHVIGEKYILELDVSMDYVIVVHMFQRLHQLPHDGSRSVLTQAALLLDKVEE